MAEIKEIQQLHTISEDESEKKPDTGLKLNSKMAKKLQKPDKTQAKADKSRNEMTPDLLVPAEVLQSNGQDKRINSAVVNSQSDFNKVIDKSTAENNEGD